MQSFQANPIFVDQHDLDASVVQQRLQSEYTIGSHDYAAGGDSAAEADSATGADSAAGLQRVLEVDVSNAAGAVHPWQEFKHTIQAQSEVDSAYGVSLYVSSLHLLSLLI